MDIRKNVAAIYPLTPLQQGLLFHTEADASGAYVVQSAYQLKGDASEAKFRQAWELTIARHPVLRSIFGGITTAKPVQVILKTSRLSWSSYDWKNYSEQDCEKRFQALTEAEQKTGFAADRPPLMRFYWLEMADNQARFIWTYHHALLDGWSVPLVLRDVMHCYAALCSGQEPRLPAPADYRHYVAWLKQQDKSQASTYWKTLLADFSEPNQLKLAAPSETASKANTRKNEASQNIEPQQAVEEFHASFTPQITGQLKSFCQKNRITLNLLCQAALSIITEVYSGSDDIVFGTVVSGRPANLADVNELVGAFINTVPVRAKVAPNKTVQTLIEELRQQQVARDSHSFLPLRDIQKLGEVKDGAPLFNSLFVFENFPVDPDLKQTISGLEISRVLVEDKTSYPLTIAAKVTDTLVLTTQFDTAKYQRQDIHELVENYQLILLQIVENIAAPIAELSLLTDSQLRALVHMGKGPVNKDNIESVLTRFEKMASIHPDQTALVADKELVSYQALNQKASQLAAWLTSQDITAGDRVALYLPSGIEFVVSVLAVLKVSACYVPVDINQPEERTRQILQHAKVNLVISQTGQDWIQAFAPELKAFDWEKHGGSLELPSLTSVQHETFLNTDVDVRNNAYIMFTSGTTGVPKAIPIRHDSVANHIDDAIKRYSMSTQDRVLQFASVGFDISVEEIWSSLCSGASLIFFDRNDLSIDTFEQVIASQEITMLDLPTAYWHTWVGAGLNLEKLVTLKKLIVGGEAARPQTLQKWRKALPHVDWFNTYGPTETTVVASVWQAPDVLDDSGIIPIGCAIQNVQCLVLDEQQRILPKGVSGELCIGGMGLTPGYFERPDLDEQVFIQKTINGEKQRFYRTGDLVHWNDNGQLIYQGRRDNQVKLRGYRIELSAVENELCQCTGVKQAHVCLHSLEPEKQREQERANHSVLVAYITIDSAVKGQDSSQILTELRQRVPGYMVPSSITVLDQMPLTNNGKIDAQKLPEPTLVTSAQDAVAPFTSFQKQLTGYWQSAIGKDIPSIHSNFFEMGGDSIHAIQIVSLAKQDGFDLQIKELFESPTIGLLASLLESREDADKSAEDKAEITIGENALSEWHSWLWSNQWLSFEKPQLISVQLNSAYSEAQMRTAMSSVITQLQALRSEWVHSAGDTLQRITPWSELSSYTELTISTTDTSEIHQALAKLQSQHTDCFGTHAVHLKFETQSSMQEQLVLMIYGSHLDEVSQQLLQQKILSVLGESDETEEESLKLQDGSFEQNRLRKAIKKGDYNRAETEANSGSDITTEAHQQWQKWQQNAALFSSSEYHAKPLVAEITLCPDKLQGLCQQYYTSEAELLTFLTMHAISEHWGGSRSGGANSETVSYLLSSARQNPFWKTDLSNVLGDFRSLIPAQFGFAKSEALSDFETTDFETVGNDLKEFKQQYRNWSSQALHYLAAQRSKQIAAPELEKSVLICTSDLDKTHSEDANAVLANTEQEWNAVTSKAGLQTAGLVRFIKTDHRIHVIWQLNSAETTQRDANELARHSLRRFESLTDADGSGQHNSVDNGSGELCPLIPQDFPHCPIDASAIDKLWQDVQTSPSTAYIKAIYPITPLQRGMLFHSQQDAPEEASNYLVQSAWEVAGSLNSKKMRQAWQQVMMVHPTLRSFFWGIDSESPAQVVLDNATVEWYDDSWVGLKEDSKHTRFEQLLQAERQLAFDRLQAPPMRLYCIQLEAEQYRIVWTYHHALLDGWSVPIVLRDVLKAYANLIEHDSAIQQAITKGPDYQEFASWMAETSFESAKNYWQEELAGFAKVNDFKLPRDGSAASGASATSGTLQTSGNTETNSQLNQEDWQRLNQFCQQAQITLNHACQAAWAILIGKYSGDNDIVFGTTVSGRPAEVSGINELVGAFINTAPVRIKLDNNASLLSLLSDVRRQHIVREEHAWLPLWEVQHFSDVKRSRVDFADQDNQSDLFTSLLVYENYPVDPNLTQSIADLEITPISAHGDSNYPLTLVLVPGDTLTIRLRYRDISDDTGQKIVEDFKSILGQLCQPQKRLVDIAVAPLHKPQQAPQLHTSTLEDHASMLENQKPGQLSVLTGPPSQTADMTVPEIFQQMVARLPKNTAIIAGDQRITYEELDQQSNGFARLLLSKGLNKQDVVALRLPRGIAAIVSIVAIQKLGAVYLPLDLAAPQERLNYMLSTSHCRAVINQSESDQFASFSGEIILFDSEETQSALSNNAELPAGTVTLDNPAYINFTSGTEGNPKGVLVPQRAIPRVVCNPGYVELNDATVMLHASSLAFDATTFEIWGALLNGGCLVTYVEEHMDLQDLNALIAQHSINTLWLTAGLFPQWVDSLKNTSITVPKYILTGGDVVSPQAVKTLYNRDTNTQVINGYGPTESTTFACCHPIARHHDWRQAIPVGLPINGTGVSVVNELLQPVSVGESGELLISGEGLALGYVADEQKTAEKFVQVNGELAYRTGDKVRLTANGIEFLGRLDRQVKIRGFRIELTEIEGIIRQLMVKDCVVAAQESTNNIDSAGASAGKKLHAIIEAGSETDISEQQVLSHVKRHLPEYMVPAKVTFLEALPLTANGKVDHRRLPQISSPDHVSIELSDTDASASALLTAIWSALLGVDSAELSDDSQFFETGGDSIVAIQLVSKAAEMGMHLSVKQIFNNPRLADMAAVASFEEKQQSFDPRHHGAVALSPIQHWFFEHFSDYPDHWNQAILLEVPKDFCLDSMNAALAVLTQHHDLLRSKYRKVALYNETQAKQWQQFVSPWDPGYQLKQVSLFGADNWQSELETHCTEQQQAVAIETGEILKAVHFTLPASQSSDRLFIACHHLMIDGVSWRILMSDLFASWQKIQSGTKPELKRTHSYRQWLAALQKRVPVFVQELPYWQKQCQPTSVNLAGNANVPNIVADEQKVQAQLSAEETRSLLSQTSQAYNTSPEQLLLTAVLLALSDQTNSDSIRIDLEGHGRDGHGDQLDLSNTLGWFTAIYPVRFDQLAPSDPISTLKQVKEQVKAVPQGGVGYSVLKYLTDNATAQTLQTPVSDAISFNYMGQVRNQENSEFAIAHEFTGPGNDPRQKRTHLLAFGGIVEQEQLKIHLQFSEKLHCSSEMEALLQRAMSHLQTLITHCAANPYAGATPSDFPEYPGLEQGALNHIWQHAKDTPKRGGIEAIGLLTGPQQGMLYHSQANTQEALYVEQMSYEISGPVDISKLKTAWQHTVDKHDIFRVEFLALDSESPYQVIRENAEIRWQESNLTGLDSELAQSRIDELLREDRSQPFDFQNAPLMRLRVCRFIKREGRFINGVGSEKETGQESIILSWTYHHALMDGWSMPLVFKSLFDAYKAELPIATSGSDHAAPSFRKHLHWLGKQDKDAAKAWWKDTLKGFTSPTPLMVKRTTPDMSVSGVGELNHSLPAEVYEKLQSLCKQQGVTLNAICQMAWASLLSRYSGEKDIVFAITSSGRPGEIEGINDIVGPFINTLPVRIRIDEQLSLQDMLSQVHLHQADIDKYGHLSLTDIHAQSDVPNGVELFESIFAFENYPIDDAVKQNQLPFTLKPLEWTSQTNFPLTVIWAPGESLSVKVQYAFQQFEQATVERLVEHYMAIISGIAQQQHPLKVNVLADAEKREMQAWNNTFEAFDYNHCIHDLFSAQAQRTPDAVALYFEDKEMTYDELDKQSTALAYELQRQNVAHVDTLIAVCLPRGIGQVIGCLGIMKAGGAYLPMDTNWPAERRKKLLVQGKVTAVIGTQAIMQELDSQLPFVDPANLSPWRPDMQLRKHVTPTDLAYVIFTSGSTGEPKGVMIEHRSAINTFIDINQRFKVTAKDRVLAVSSLTFDLSVYDLFGIFCVGGAAVLPNSNEATNPQSWCRLVAQHRVSVWDTVPQLMSILCEEAEADGAANISSIRVVMMSGDWIPLDLPGRIRQQLPGASINSLGGATEGSIWSITYPIVQQDPNWRSVPYGKPMANQAFHILDDRDQPCPVGVPGHLYIGGIGVARGYWADAERTAKQFRPHPQTGEPIYWTGDLARYGSDGNIEFLGRSDFQVKVNGFRIELGEIEAVLNQVESVARSVVIAWEDENNNRSLIAYVIADADQFHQGQCLQHLQMNLPRYMVPVAVIRVDKMPLSSNGKIDRKALPAPTQEQLTQEYVAPATEAQSIICECWMALLQKSQVSITDNFFDLGGHSLLATQMVSRLARVLNIEVPLEMIFRCPTVEALAEEIDSRLAETPAEDFEEGEL